MDRINVGGGKFVTFNASFAMGVKDKSAYTTLDDYQSKIWNMSSEYFVIYDVETEKAWLLNGATVLLHLLRAFYAYAHDPANDMHDTMRSEAKDNFDGFPGKTGKGLAVAVLLHMENRHLPLWEISNGTTIKIVDKADDDDETKRKTSHTLERSATNFPVQDRVTVMADALEVAIAMFNDKEETNGYKTRLKLLPRNHLTGYDFMEFARPRKRIPPKVAIINQYTSGWTEFTRELGCVGLFGRGFGDLMGPVASSSPIPGIPAPPPCRFNTHHPRLLAITIKDFGNIVKERGRRPKGKHWTIIDTIRWYNPEGAFANCNCSTAGQHKQHQTQVFVSAPLPQAYGSIPRYFDLEDDSVVDGALLVGHTSKFKLLFKVCLKR